MRIAIIDTGTNSTRLLVADVQGAQVEEMERLTTVTRLGAGVDGGGSLHADARDRVRSCVETYARRISELGAERVVVLATSSVRDARDGEEFLASLAASHGFDWKLLTGEQEARLSFAGATIGIDTALKVVLFDVGGGSTEVVTGARGSVGFARSLKLGCVRLTERFIKSDLAAEREMNEAAVFIDDIIKREVDINQLGKPDITIAVAGTATALAAIDLDLKEYDRRLIHGHVISAGRIAELLKRLAGMTVAEKLDIPAMEKGRADVIVAGTLILDRLMRYIGAAELTVRELDILDGAAVAAAEERI